MIAAALLAATPVTALDAERAFAADAQRIGQWTAFRKWATDDATMFVPQPVKAQEWLKDRPDPTKAIDWWPTASFLSCDGTMAANTGGWRQPDGSVGYFSTIWKQQADRHWKWTVDGGDDLTVARSKPAEPQVRHAACGGKPKPAPTILFRCAPQASGSGSSADKTLAYFWYVACGGGARGFHVWLWNGSGWNEVVADHVALKPAS